MNEINEWREGWWKQKTRRGGGGGWQRKSPRIIRFADCLMRVEAGPPRGPWERRTGRGGPGWTDGCPHPNSCLPLWEPVAGSPCVPVSQRCPEVGIHTAPHPTQAEFHTPAKPSSRSGLCQPQLSPLPWWTCHSPVKGPTLPASSHF